MISSCPKCDAVLGPWEDDDGCVGCNTTRRRSLADRAVSALEQVELPIYRWDISRQIQRTDPAVWIHPGSLNTVLATDWRTCWGGPGLYGLYRHGLLPGVRDLGSAAAVFIHASDRTLTTQQVQFVLRYVGYRFSPNSLPQALTRAESNGCFVRTWGGYIGRRENLREQRSVARTLGFAQRGPVFRDVVQRAATQAEAALATRRQRLEAAQQPSE
jgi:hypothetical protein